MSPTYRIDDLTLETGRQRVMRNGREVPLGPLTYQFFLVLIEKAPDLVTHDEIADAVWGGRSVSPETIKQRAKLLRDAIGDDAHSPRYVELVRGRGYRLMPSVAAEPVEVPAKWRVARAVAVGVALAVGAFFWQFADSPTTPGPQYTIAVMPFADMSRDQDQRYFADGIAVEILNLLSTATPLHVIARSSSFSFRDRNEDIDAIAAKLGVSHVVEGSVRKSGERIRVTVQLVSAKDGTNVWSDSYDRELVDVLPLQNEIAKSVAAALEVELLGQASAARSIPRRVDPEAYDLYLRGRQSLRDFALGDAKRLLEQSLAIDPEFIQAYRHLGEAYVRGILDAQLPLAEYREKLRDLVDRGLERAPGDAALIALSGQLARYDGNFTLAETRFRQALQVEPSNILLQMLYAMLKGDQGYPEEVHAIGQFGRKIDPLNPLYYLADWSVNMDLWNAKEALLATTRYEAVAAPTNPAAFGLRGLTKIVLLGDIAGAIGDLEQFADIAAQGAIRSQTEPSMYYELGVLDLGDAAVEISQRPSRDTRTGDFVRAYRLLVADEVTQARELFLQLFTEREDYSASYEDLIVVRFAVDALIDRGEATRAVEIIDRLAPKYAAYRALEHLEPREFSPAPYPVKSIYSSYPALYFPDYIRALAAAGNLVGAENMLNHLDAVLRSRRERGLFFEERHEAEARALRGDSEGALDALEQAERDRTIYQSWHALLLYNPIVADCRHHPRFRAIVERVREEMRRQRRELNAESLANP